jgi:hypothetical protein
MKWLRGDIIMYLQLISKVQWDREGTAVGRLLHLCTFDFDFESIVSRVTGSTDTDQQHSSKSKVLVLLVLLDKIHMLCTVSPRIHLLVTFEHISDISATEQIKQGTQLRSFLMSYLVKNRYVGRRDFGAELALTPYLET